MSLLTFRKSLGVLIASVIAFAIAGCGGNQSAPANNAASPMSETAREQAALPLSAMAPIPKGLHCKSPVVWVNLKTKAYHEKGDPYYGRTKNGQYICKAAADAAGDHMAGSRGSMNGMSGGAAENGGSMSGATSRHHKKRSMTQESPTPYPT
jgi:hypothetical protein